MCGPVWSSLPLHIQLRGSPQSRLVPRVHPRRRRELLHHHLLRLLLHRCRGLETSLHHRTNRGPCLLWAWMAPLRIYSEFNIEKWSSTQTFLHFLSFYMLRWTWPLMRCSTISATTTWRTPGVSTTTPSPGECSTTWQSSFSASSPWSLTTSVSGTCKQISQS